MNTLLTNSKKKGGKPMDEAQELREQMLLKALMGVIFLWAEEGYRIRTGHHGEI